MEDDLEENSQILSVVTGASNIEIETYGVTLTTDVIKTGLKRIGINPLALNHTMLECDLSNKQLYDIQNISLYPNVMYLDISRNMIGDISILEKLPTLVKLNAANNQIDCCLNFSALLCDDKHAWKSGHKAVGSLLTSLNLSNNNVQELLDLSDHKFLEELLISYNQLTTIAGLHNLKYLKILDLSYNSISAIEGLDNLPIEVVKLQGNRIKFLNGLENLPRLTYLDVSENHIISLEPIRSCLLLAYLNVSKNEIEFIRQTEFLQDMKWLTTLIFNQNPCDSKELYRLRVLYRLPNLQTLDDTIVHPEEKIRAFNLYHSEKGDLQLRESVLKNIQPNAMFIDFASEQLPFDDESILTEDDLKRGLTIRSSIQLAAINVGKEIFDFVQTTIV